MDFIKRVLVFYYSFGKMEFIIFLGVFLAGMKLSKCCLSILVKIVLDILFEEHLFYFFP
jgi:hypothetical protein